MGNSLEIFDKSNCFISPKALHLGVSASFLPVFQTNESQWFCHRTNHVAKSGESIRGELEQKQKLMMRSVRKENK